jgi:hypothetical protein
LHFHLTVDVGLQSLNRLRIHEQAFLKLVRFLPLLSDTTIDLHQIKVELLDYFPLDDILVTFIADPQLLILQNSSFEGMLVADGKPAEPAVVAAVPGFKLTVAEVALVAFLEI